MADEMEDREVSLGRDFHLVVNSEDVDLMK